MVLKTFAPEEFNSSAHIPVKPLSIEGFARFGSIVSPDQEIENRKITTSTANYGTAIKLRQVSSFVNNFQESSNPNFTTNINIFRCFPPWHLITPTNSGFQYLGKVLERHPFSTQTFSPMGRSRSKYGYIVVCALNDPNDKSGSNLPDPKTIEAFYCMGNQAVTYGPGTWHAPMIAMSEFWGNGEALDKELKYKDEKLKNEDFIDFQVLINENNVDDDDCQECYFDPGFILNFQNL